MAKDRYIPEKHTKYKPNTETPVQGTAKASSGGAVRPKETRAVLTDAFRKSNSLKNNKRSVNRNPIK